MTRRLLRADTSAVNLDAKFLDGWRAAEDFHEPAVRELVEAARAAVDARFAVSRQAALADLRAALARFDHLRAKP